jgi:hypothetical protein
MDCKTGRAADATTPRRLSLAASAEGQALGGPPSGTYGIEGFSPVISLQVAARAARYAIGSGAFDKGFGAGTSHAIGIQQGSGRINLKGHVSRSRSFQLVLAFAIGAAAYACVVYFMLGGSLLLPLRFPA